jgi:hypothetical protein
MEQFMQVCPELAQLFMDYFLKKRLTIHSN